MAKLEDLVVHIRGETAPLKQSLDKATSDIGQFANTTNKKLDSIEKSQSRLAAGAAGIGTAIKAYIGAELIRGIGNAAIQMDALNAKMNAAVGAGDNAAASLSFVKSEASRLGLEFTSAASAFSGFAASATRSGLTLDQTRTIFTGVAEAAAAMKLSTADQGLVFRAIEQMAAKGVVSMEELRGQLGERLPGAVQIFAASMGVTNAQFLKMVQNGEVGVNALVKFGEALHNEFGAAAEQAATNAAAQITRLKNTIFDLQVSIANSGVMELFTHAVKGANAAITMMQDAFSRMAINFEYNLGRVKNAFASLYNAYVDIKKKFGGSGDYMIELPISEAGYLAKLDNLEKKTSEKMASIFGMGVGGGAGKPMATPPIVKVLGKDIPEASKKASQAVKDANKQIEDSFKGFNMQQLATIRSFDDLKRVGLDAIQSILQSGLNSLFTASNKKGGILQSLGGFFTSSIGSLFGGLFGRAAGGSVSPNVPYLVGERGPEVIVPNVGGTVMNRNQIAGQSSGGQAINVIQNITIGSSVSAAVRQEVARMLPDIRRATVAGVEDARMRGAMS